MAGLSLTCSPFSGGPDLSVAPRLINHYPASVAPGSHISPRINASGGGDLVNPPAATIGPVGPAGKSKPFQPKTLEDKPNKSDGQRAFNLPRHASPCSSWVY